MRIYRKLEIEKVDREMLGTERNIDELVSDGRATRQCGARNRLFRLINMQNWALRLIPFTYRSFAAPPIIPI